MKITIISCFDVNDHRVNLLYKVLENDGHQVSVLIPDFLHIPKCRRTNCPEKMEMLPARPYYSNFSLSRIRSHIQFSKDAISRAGALKPDLLWVLVPPNSLVKDAALYKKQHPETKLVLDFTDLWPEAMPLAGFSHTPPGRVWRSLRDRHMGAADIIVAEHGSYWKTLQKNCGRKKLHTLYISRTLKLRRPAERPPSDRISLCLLGEIDQNLDFGAICRLIQDLRYPVELHVIGGGSEESLLRRTAEQAGAAVFFHGNIYSSGKKRAIFDRCHCGLNLLTRGPHSGLTMKSADYFCASLPVINNVPGDTWEFIDRHPVGLNYGGTAAISAPKLLALQCRREQIRALYDTYFAEKVFSDNLRAIIQI